MPYVTTTPIFIAYVTFIPILIPTLNFIASITLIISSSLPHVRPGSRPLPRLRPRSHLHPQLPHRFPPHFLFSHPHRNPCFSIPRHLPLLLGLNFWLIVLGLNDVSVFALTFRPHLVQAPGGKTKDPDPRNHFVVRFTAGTNFEWRHRLCCGHRLEGVRFWIS